MRQRQPAGLFAYSAWVRTSNIVALYPLSAVLLWPSELSTRRGIDTGSDYALFKSHFPEQAQSLTSLRKRNYDRRMRLPKLSFEIDCSTFPPKIILKGESRPSDREMAIR